MALCLERFVFRQPVRKKLFDQIAEFSSLADQPGLNAEMRALTDVCRELHEVRVSPLRKPGAVRFRQRSGCDRVQRAFGHVSSLYNHRPVGRSEHKAIINRQTSGGLDSRTDKAGLREVPV